MLGDADAGASDDERRSGGDVERVGAVAAGADDVDDVGSGDGLGVTLGDFEAGGDDLRRLAADAQGREERADLRGRGCAGEDLFERGRGLGPGRGSRRSTRARIAAWTLTGRPPFMLRKFRSKSLPWSVAMDSGWNCTPSTVRSRWRTPMITPLSDLAVTSSTAGRVVGRARERMVACGVEALGNACEHAAAVVADGGNLAVLDFAGAAHLAAVDVVDALVAEANAEDRHLARERADDIARNASVAGVAGSGRDDDVIGFEREGLFHGDSRRCASR